MREVELTNLLQERSPVNPSRLIAVSASLGGRLSLKVQGFPWWRDRYSPKDTDQIDIEFGGIDSGSINVAILRSDWFEDEFFDYIRIERTSELLWCASRQVDLFCNDPIPDVSKYLQDVARRFNAVGYPGAAIEVLARDGTGAIPNLFRFNANGPFLLARTSPLIAEQLREALDLQSINSSIFEYDGEPLPDLKVTIAGHGFFCESVIARFEVESP